MPEPQQPVTEALPAESYLDPKVLSAISSLDLLARKEV